LCRAKQPVGYFWNHFPGIRPPFPSSK
jgi:hypothetical protein